MLAVNTVLAGSVEVELAERVHHVVDGDGTVDENLESGAEVLNLSPAGVAGELQAQGLARNRCGGGARDVNGSLVLSLGASTVVGAQAVPAKGPSDTSVAEGRDDGSLAARVEKGSVVAHGRSQGDHGGESEGLHLDQGFSSLTRSTDRSQGRLKRCF